MTKLTEIEKLNKDNWFCDNPDGKDVKAEINWLIYRIKRLEKVLKFWASESEWMNVPIEVQINRAKKVLEE